MIYNFKFKVLIIQIEMTLRKAEMIRLGHQT